MPCHSHLLTFAIARAQYEVAWTSHASSFVAPSLLQHPAQYEVVWTSHTSSFVAPLAPMASRPIRGGVDLTHLLVCSPLLIQCPAQYKASRRWFGPNIVPLSHPLAPLNDPEIPMRGGTGPPLCMYCSFLCIIVGVFDAEYYTYSLFLYLEIRTKGIIKNAVIPA